MCFEPCFCLLWGWGSSPVGMQGSTVLLTPWRAFGTPGSSPGREHWPEQGSSALAQPQHNIQSSCLCLLPAPGAFPEAGEPLSGIRWSWLGSAHCTGEISLLGSACTQLMGSLVQHGRDMGSGEVKAMRPFSFTCLFLSHGNNELSLWRAVRRSCALNPSSSTCLSLCMEHGDSREFQQLQLLLLFLCTERTPYLSLLCPFYCQRGLFSKTIDKYAYLLTATSCWVSAGLFSSVKLNYSPGDNVTWYKWQKMTEHVKTKCVSLEYPEGSSWSKEVIPLIPQLLSQLPLLHRWVHSPQLDSQRLKIEIVLFPECLSNQKSHPVCHLLNVLFFFFVYYCSKGQFLQPCLHLALFVAPHSCLAQSSLHQSISPCQTPHLLSLLLISINETPTTLPFLWASLFWSM